jgi:hypothetical protein
VHECARAIITRCDWPPEKKSGFDAHDRAARTGRAARPPAPRARERHAVVRSVEDQVVADRDRAVEIARCGTTATCARASDRIAHDVDAATNAPLRWAHAGREHPDGRRLPGAVRPEEPEDLAPADGERDAVDRVTSDFG